MNISGGDGLCRGTWQRALFFSAFEAGDWIKFIGGGMGKDRINELRSPAPGNQEALCLWWVLWQRHQASSPWCRLAQQSLSPAPLLSHLILRFNRPVNRNSCHLL